MMRATENNFIGTYFNSIPQHQLIFFMFLLSKFVIIFYVTLLILEVLY